MIENINLKLEGLKSVTREDLIELINSWGRLDSQETNDEIQINQCEPKECYPLENLDVSQIDDMSYIFRYSMYNGDLSKWDTSICKTMSCMFGRSLFNNDSLKNWNVSNVTNMNYMFYKSNFNGDISKWDFCSVKVMVSIFEKSPFNGDISKWNFNNGVECYEIFRFNENFRNKYNNGEMIPENTKEFLEWFEENREKMREINTSKEEVLDFFNFNKNIKTISIIK